jgi:probable phosphoglycerate mutase
MSRLLLVRHGESEWNALGRWQGQADPPLSDHGRHQAAVAARRIGAVDLIVASTLQRARSTAAIIAESLGVGPVRSDHRLIERDAGEWSGLTRAEIKESWPGYLAENPDDRSIERRPPGWEPDSSLLVRAQQALAEIVGPLGASDSALVVTHGGVIYALEARLGAPRRYLPNLGARWIEMSVGTNGHHLELGERVHLYDPENDPDQFDATPPDPQAV